MSFEYAGMGKFTTKRLATVSVVDDSTMRRERARAIRRDGEGKED